MTDKLCPRERVAGLAAKIRYWWGSPNFDLEATIAGHLEAWDRAAPAQEPEWDAPPPPMKVDGSGASIARYAAPAQQDSMDDYLRLARAIEKLRRRFKTAENAEEFEKLALGLSAAPAQEPPVCPYCHRGGPARDVNEPHCRDADGQPCPGVDLAPAPGASEDELPDWYQILIDRDLGIAEFHAMQVKIATWVRESRDRLTALREELERLTGWHLAALRASLPCIAPNNNDAQEWERNQIDAALGLIHRAESAEAERDALQARCAELEKDAGTSAG